MKNSNAKLLFLSFTVFVILGALLPISHAASFKEIFAQRLEDKKEQNNKINQFGIEEKTIMHDGIKRNP